MRYKLLGRSGLRVSELCLGTMTFGTEWPIGADYETSKGVFDAFANAGGTFVDTANRYTEGTSEKWVGEFVKADRDHFVVATKYTLRDRAGDLNFGGNHRKNMMRSVEGSLKRMSMDCIDLLWLHAWDGLTPIDEVLRGLDDLVSQGKVHYIGISDTPAWVVSQANTIADFRGWNRFVALQVEYSLVQRTAERDLMPMAQAHEMSVTSWGSLAGGALTGKYLKGEAGRVPENSLRRNERANTIAHVVVDIAGELNMPPAAVALAWVQSYHPLMIPIVGARRKEQLVDSLKAVEVELVQEQLERLEIASAIEMGFPHDFLKSDIMKDVVFGGEYDKLVLPTYRAARPVGALQKRG